MFAHKKISQQDKLTQLIIVLKHYDILDLRLDFHLSKKVVLFSSMKLFKNNEKSFLFHVKSSFHDLDI